MAAEDESTVQFESPPSANPKKRKSLFFHERVPVEKKPKSTQPNRLVRRTEQLTSLGGVHRHVCRSRAWFQPQWVMSATLPFSVSSITTAEFHPSFSRVDVSRRSRRDDSKRAYTRAIGAL